MENFIIIGWPEIQYIMNEVDFGYNATLIEPNAEIGIGSSTFLVNKEWLESLNEK